MNKEELYNLYDKVVSATYANIFSLSKNDIVFKNYYYKNKSHRFFLEVATMVAYMTNKEIYLNIPLWELIKIKFKKKNKHIHRISKKKLEKLNAIDIIEVGLFESAAFNVEPSIFGEIYEAYYERG